MNEAQTVALLESSTSAAEWNAHLDKIKAAHGGDYPDFWYGAVVASGLAARTAAKWGGSAEMRLVSVRPRG